MPGTRECILPAYRRHTMRRISALVLLLTPLTLTAQSAPAMLRALPASTDCPVQATAHRDSAGDIVIVGSPQATGSANLSLTLQPPDGKRITEATATVHALSMKSRVWTLAGNPEPDLVRQFTLTNTRSGKAAFVAAVALAQAATVVWVEVTSLRYADSTTWHAGPNSTCRVVPEALTPVLARS